MLGAGVTGAEADELEEGAAEGLGGEGAGSTAELDASGAAGAALGDVAADAELDGSAAVLLVEVGLGSGAFGAAKGTSSMLPSAASRRTYPAFTQWCPRK
jgi:hypothetical protein